MPLSSLSLLGRNSWPFTRRADRESRAGRTQTDPPGAGITDVTDPRHADNSARARALRGEYRRAMRSGEIPPRPAHPPGYDDAASAPEYRATPGESEITIDQNARGPVRSLRHPNTASQGLAEPGSEHYNDFANPFRSLSSRNPSAPAYPDGPRADPAGPARPRIEFMPFPHEKEQSLADAVRSRARERQSNYQPPSDRPNAPRRGPEIAPRRRGIDWAAIGRGIVNGLAAMGGAPMGRM